MIHMLSCLHRLFGRAARDKMHAEEMTEEEEEEEEEESRSWGRGEGRRAESSR